MEKTKITRANYQNIQNELKKWYKKRTKVVDELRIAYDFGDLRENSEFDSAKMAEHLCNEQIKKLEHILNTSEIIENPENNKVNVGSIVTIQYLDDLSEDTYEIVNSSLVSIAENKISITSPMGATLENKEKDEIVTIKSPNGSYKIKILNIKNI